MRKRKQPDAEAAPSAGQISDAIPTAEGDGNAAQEEPLQAGGDAPANQGAAAAAAAGASASTAQRYKRIRREPDGQWTVLVPAPGLLPALPTVSQPLLPLGATFSSAKAAARAADRALIAMHGLHAVTPQLNFPAEKYTHEQQRYGPDLSVYLAAICQEAAAAAVQGTNGKAAGKGGYQGPGSLWKLQQRILRRMARNPLAVNLTLACGMCAACRQPWGSAPCQRRAFIRGLGYSKEESARLEALGPEGAAAQDLLRGMSHGRGKRANTSAAAQHLREIFQRELSAREAGTSPSDSDAFSSGDDGSSGSGRDSDRDRDAGGNAGEVGQQQRGRRAGGRDRAGGRLAGANATDQKQQEVGEGEEGANRATALAHLRRRPTAPPAAAAAAAPRAAPERLRWIVPASNTWSARTQFNAAFGRMQRQAERVAEADDAAAAAEAAAALGGEGGPLTGRRSAPHLEQQHGLSAAQHPKDYFDLLPHLALLGEVQAAAAAGSEVALVAEDDPRWVAPLSATERHQCALCRGWHGTGNGTLCPVLQATNAVLEPVPGQECEKCAHLASPGCERCVPAGLNPVLWVSPRVRTPWIESVRPATLSLMHSVQSVANAAVVDLDRPDLAAKLSPQALLALGVLAEEVAAGEVRSRQQGRREVQTGEQATVMEQDV